jgi:hypothetical protein
MIQVAEDGVLNCCITSSNVVTLNTEGGLVQVLEIEIEIHTLERTPAWTQGAAPYVLPTNAVQACGSQHTRPTALAGTSPKTGQHDWRKPKSRAFSRHPYHCGWSRAHQPYCSGYEQPVTVILGRPA